MILKKIAEKLAQSKGLMREFLLVDYIEKNASRLFYEAKGHQKNLMANVDLYSGFVYSALNIPTDIATPLFAAARISGWCAHRMEELFSNGKIMRPAYQDVCGDVPYVPLQQRDGEGLRK